MTPDLLAEFDSLEDSMRRKLKTIHPAAGMELVFSFGAFPSFSPSYRWTVYRPHGRKNEKQPFAAFTVWRRDLDMEKLRSPVERLKYPKDLIPTIEEDVVALTEAEVRGMEQSIMGISIPLYLGRPDYAGLDGTSFEFHFGDYLRGGTLHWWQHLPVEWQPFTNSVMNIIDELQKRRGSKATS